MALSSYERRWMEMLAVDGHEVTPMELAELRGATVDQESFTEDLALALEDLGYPPTAI